MSPTAFWRLTEPDYDSDYRSIFINGQMEHPFGLPGVACESCGQTWGGSRVLAVPCPEEMRHRKELTAGWPISGRAHRALRNEVAAALERHGCAVGELRPGDAFQPGFLDVPSKPEADFLWASIGSVVMSERIRGLLEEVGCEGVQFCPVTLRRIGNRSPALPPPIPPSGEPEDLLQDISLREPGEDSGRYFEMLVTAESNRPPGAEVTSSCDLCGREEYDRNRRQLVMRPEMWRGDDVFLLATTLWIVITDRIRRELEKARPSNVVVQPL